MPKRRRVGGARRHAGAVRPSQAGAADSGAERRAGQTSACASASMHDATSRRRGQSSPASFGFLRALHNEGSLRERLGQGQGLEPEAMGGHGPFAPLTYSHLVPQPLARRPADLADDALYALVQRRHRMLDQPFARA